MNIIIITHTFSLSLSLCQMSERGERREKERGRHKKPRNFAAFLSTPEAKRNHAVFSLPSLSPSLLPLHLLLLQPLLNHPIKSRPSSLSSTKEKEEEESFSRHNRKISPSCSQASLSFLFGYFQWWTSEKCVSDPTISKIFSSLCFWGIKHHGPTLLRFACVCSIKAASDRLSSSCIDRFVVLSLVYVILVVGILLDKGFCH